MGTPDNYGNVQLKVGEYYCRHFNLGDPSPIRDGIYIGYEGAIVIRNGIFVAESSDIFDKWGDRINLTAFLDKKNPVNIAFQKIKKTKEAKHD